MELDFSFNGKNASEYGIRLQSAISVSDAKPRVNAITIPARNEELHIYDGSFENRTITASCFVLADNVSEAMARINSFLFDDFMGGYKPLITSYDPNNKWLVQVVSAGAITPRLNKLNAFDIRFTAKPYKVNLTDGSETL